MEILNLILNLAMGIIIFVLNFIHSPLMLVVACIMAFMCHQSFKQDVDSVRSYYYGIATLVILALFVLSWQTIISLLLIGALVKSYFKNAEKQNARSEKPDYTVEKALTAELNDKDDIAPDLQSS